MIPTDTVVIGGGVAGLAAAGELARNGFTVSLLEARERLGGRVFTARPEDWPGPVELGAEFVHGGNTAFWRRLEKFRIGVKRVPPRHWLFRDRQLERVNVEERIARVTERIEPARMQGWSFAEFMRGQAGRFGEKDRELAEGFVEGFQAAPMSRMSVTAVEGETLSDQEQFFLPGGYGRLVARLAGGLPEKYVGVFRGAPATCVRWKRGYVQVFAGSERFVARALIITLPLGVLRAEVGQRGAVEFDPPLRAKARIAARMGVGHVIRLSLRFDARRWRELVPAELRRARGGFGFIHSRLEGVPVWWSLSRDPVLTGWAGGPAAEALGRRSPQAILGRALSSLARVWGVSSAELRRSIADWAMHNWSQDPFSRGAYSFTAAGSEGAAEKLRVPLQDTLFFGGEATADGEEVGTVHGALASGLRAAQEAVRALR